MIVVKKKLSVLIVILIMMHSVSSEAVLITMYKEFNALYHAGIKVYTGISAYYEHYRTSANFYRMLAKYYEYNLKYYLYKQDTHIKKIRAYMNEAHGRIKAYMEEEYEKEAEFYRYNIEYYSYKLDEAHREIMLHANSASPYVMMAPMATGLLDDNQRNNSHRNYASHKSDYVMDNDFDDDMSLFASVPEHADDELSVLLMNSASENEIAERMKKFCDVLRHAIEHLHRFF